MRGRTVRIRGAAARCAAGSGSRPFFCDDRDANQMPALPCLCVAVPVPEYACA